MLVLVLVVVTIVVVVPFDGVGAGEADGTDVCGGGAIRKYQIKLIQRNNTMKKFTTSGRYR